MGNGVFRQNINDSLDNDHGILLVLSNNDILEKSGLFSDIHTFMSSEFTDMFNSGGPVLNFEFSLRIKSFFHPVNNGRGNITFSNGANGSDGFFSFFIVNKGISGGLDFGDFGIEFNNGLIFSVFLNSNNQSMGGFVISGFQSVSGFF